MTVRAKFLCTAITVSMGSRKGADGVYRQGEMHSIKMQPVYANGDPNHENSKFWDASPGGTFELNCVNPDAVAQFQVGKEYYFDITPAG